jgi:hypothetical protein
VQVYGKYYNEPTIKAIQAMVTVAPEISRRELSRQICKKMEWYSPNGKMQDMGCRKALAELNRRGKIKLPDIKQNYAFQKKVSSNIELKIAKLKCKLSEVGDIEIEPITSRYSKDSKAWFSIIKKYHYLGSSQLCGSQLRYIIKSPKYGYIGALSFCSGTRQLKARDEYIGWSEAGRSENIKRVINNARFLIVPTIEVKNLGSYIFSRVLSRIAKDWERRYKVEPLLVESYVDPSRFQGTVYKASNWRYVGDSSGRRDGIAKNIFVYPLSWKWREELCKESPKSLGEKTGFENPGNWVEKEFGRVRFYDNRLKTRLYKIAEDFYENPQANIPEACGNKAGSIGAYRFFQNKKVSMEVLLEAHLESTIDRIRNQKIILAPQDTTVLDYNTRPMTEGLGPTGHIGGKSIGLILHDTLAFTEQGVPLGILDAQCWARNPDEQGKRYKRKELPIEQKESMKWLRSFQKVSALQKLCPDTIFISIGDRESDIYELFQEADKDEFQPKLLVRSTRKRNRKVEEEYLWEYMQKQDASGNIEIHIPRKGNRKARNVPMEICYAEVELSPPNRLKKSAPVRVWVVYLHECEDEESEDTPIEWMLITTVEVKDFDKAKMIVDWYLKRWGIEIYHRTLKSGCRIEDRQLETADRLEAALGIDMVIAWRIYHMTMLGREVPDSPCTLFFKEEEWKALHCYTYKTTKTPKEPPSLSKAIKMLGKMGGHLGRKSDGMPGTETLWRGLQRLDTATEMYMIFTNPSPDDS